MLVLFRRKMMRLIVMSFLIRSVTYNTLIILVVKSKMSKFADSNKKIK